LDKLLLRPVTVESPTVKLIRIDGTYRINGAPPSPKAK